MFKNQASVDMSKTIWPSALVAKDCVQIEGLKSRPGQEIFCKKGAFRGKGVTYIKFQSKSGEKISWEERFDNLLLAIAKTVLSLSLALFSQKTQEHWAKAIFGKTHTVILIAESECRESVLTLKEIVIKAFFLNAHLKDVSAELQDDDDVVLTALRNKDFCDTLKYASPRLRDMEEVVGAAVDVYGISFLYASPRLKNHKDIALRSVKSCPAVFHLLPSEELRNDPEIREAYLKRHYSPSWKSGESDLTRLETP